MEERQITTQTVQNTTNQEMYDLTMYDVPFMYDLVECTICLLLSKE